MNKSWFGFGLVLVWFGWVFLAQLTKSWLVWFAFSKATIPNHLIIHDLVCFLRPNQ